MATVSLTKENAQSTIDDNEIVLIDFWASWCGPCRAFGPIFEAVSENHEDIVFGSCNTENEQELAGMFGIQAIPTLIVFKDKVIVFKHSGVIPAADLEKLIAKIQELDMVEVHKKIAEQEGD